MDDLSHETGFLIGFTPSTMFFKKNRKAAKNQMPDNCSLLSQAERRRAEKSVSALSS